MESEFIKSLQNKLKQANLGRIEKPKEAKGIGAEKRNEKRQEDYEDRLYDAKSDRFTNRLNILGSAIPETPEQYVELFQFMELYHNQLTDAFDKVEKIPSAYDAIGDNYFMMSTMVNDRGTYIISEGTTPESIYERYLNNFPVYQMKHRHYLNAAMRFPDDPTLSTLCAEHIAQYDQLKEDIFKRYEVVKEENTARISREEEAKKQAKIAEREELQNTTFKVFMLKNWKLIAGVIIAFLILYWIWNEFLS